MRGLALEHPPWARRTPLRHWNRYWNRLKHSRLAHPRWRARNFPTHWLRAPYPKINRHTPSRSPGSPDVLQFAGAQLSPMALSANAEAGLHALPQSQAVSHFMFGASASQTQAEGAFSKRLARGVSGPKGTSRRSLDVGRCETRAGLWAFWGGTSSRGRKG